MDLTTTAASLPEGVLDRLSFPRSARAFEGRRACADPFRGRRRGPRRHSDRPSRRRGNLRDRQPIEMGLPEISRRRAHHELAHARISPTKIVGATSAAKGVDVVLNSLSGAVWVERSFSVLKTGRSRLRRDRQAGRRCSGSEASACPDAAYFTFELGAVIARDPAESIPHRRGESARCSKAASRGPCR